MTPNEIRAIGAPKNEEDVGIVTCLMLQEIAAQLAETKDYLADLYNELQSWRRQS